MVCKTFHQFSQLQVVTFHRHITVSPGHSKNCIHNEEELLDVGTNCTVQWRARLLDRMRSLTFFWSKFVKLISKIPIKSKFKWLKCVQIKCSTASKSSQTMPDHSWRNIVGCICIKLQYNPILSIYPPIYM